MTDKASTQDSPDWADKVVKIPRIPAEGPMPTAEATAADKPKKGESAAKSKPVLPPPPPLRKPRLPAAPAVAKPAAKPVKVAAAAAPAAETPLLPPKPVPVKPAARTAPVKPIPVKPAPVKPVPVKPIPVRPEAKTAPISPTDPIKPETIQFTADPEPTTAAVTVSELPTKKRRRDPRRARLHISRIDPWSAMKISFMFSIAFGIMFFLAIYFSWTVLETGGVFAKLSEELSVIISDPTGNNTSGFDISTYVNSDKVLGFAALLAVINVVIMTALGTIAAFLYNLASTVIGGIEVTLTED
jgi:hypothetical protein